MRPQAVVAAVIAASLLFPLVIICALLADIASVLPSIPSQLLAHSGKRLNPLPNSSTLPLVTGCGRGGTHSVAEALESIGVPAVHEGAEPGAVSVSWLYGGHAYFSYPFETSSSYVARTDKNPMPFGPVVLLVRNPLDVISSTRRCFCAQGSRLIAGQAHADRDSWDFVEENLNVTELLPHISSWSELEVDDVRRSMAYWVGWNRLIESRHCPRLAGYADFKKQLKHTHITGGHGQLSTVVPGKLCYLQQAHPTFSAHVVNLENPDLLLQLSVLLQLPGPLVARARDNVAAAAAAATSSSSSSFSHRLPHASSGGWKSLASKATYGRVSWADMWHAAPELAQQAWTMAQRYGYNSRESKVLRQYLAESPA